VISPRKLKDYQCKLAFSPKFHKEVADTYGKRKGWKMKRKFAIAIPALILATSFLATPAIADTKPPAPSEANDPRAIYKLAQDKFVSDLKDYEEKRRAINKSFKEAVDKALSDARSLNVSTQSQMQKRQNMNIRHNLVIEATAIRDAAIESLGLPPIAPTPPAKAAKSEKSKKPKP
jgi:hypothetical protein